MPPRGSSDRHDNAEGSNGSNANSQTGARGAGKFRRAWSGPSRTESPRRFPPFDISQSFLIEEVGTLQTEREDHDRGPRAADLRQDKIAAGDACMLARLGNVAFYVGIIIAVLWLAAIAWSLGHDRAVLGATPGFYLSIIGIPALSVGIGWAIRYVLGGERGRARTHSHYS